MRVEDGRGGVDTQSFVIEVSELDPNEPPLMDSTPANKVALGSTYVYSAKAFDLDGDPLRYSLDWAPVGMEINYSYQPGLVRWKPTSDQLGSNYVRIRVEDLAGGFTTQTFAIEVVTDDANQPPHIISTPPLTVLLGESYNYAIMAIDPEGDSSLHWSLETSPDNMSVNVNGRLYWTPRADQLGIHDVTVRVADDLNASATLSFSILVRGDNLLPQIDSTPPIGASAGNLYAYPVRATDGDNDPLKYSLISGPADMMIDEATGVVQWRPALTQLGSHDVLIKVADNRGGVATQAYSVLVTATTTNLPPEITSSPPPAARVDEVYGYQVVAADPEGSTISYALLEGPKGVILDAASGLLQWTPMFAQRGSHLVHWIAVDPLGSAAEQAFIVTAEVNVPPRITSLPTTEIKTGARYEYDVQAWDVNSDPLTFHFDVGPPAMQMDDHGRITWSPTKSDVGAHYVQVSVADDHGGSVGQGFDLHVVLVKTKETNQSPQIISTPPLVIRVGDSYRYDAEAVDEDRDTLLWTLLTGPDGMSLDAQLGTLRWTPRADQVGSHDVSLRVTDGRQGLAAQSFEIRVLAADEQPRNAPPSITSLPKTEIEVGSSYGYDVRGPGTPTAIP